MIQLSLEIANRPGELSRVVNLLGAQKVDVKALTLSCNGPKLATGHVRMIVTDPTAAIEALRVGGLTPCKEDVVVVDIEDQPGGLAAALAALEKVNINLIYAYGFVSRLEGRALSVLGVEDPEHTGRILKDAGFRLVHSAPGHDTDLAAYFSGVWNW